MSLRSSKAFFCLICKSKIERNSEWKDMELCKSCCNILESPPAWAQGHKKSQKDKKAEAAKTNQSLNVISEKEKAVQATKPQLKIELPKEFQKKAEVKAKPVPKKTGLLKY